MFKSYNRVICNLYNTPDPGLDPCQDAHAIFNGQGGQETWNSA